MTDEQLDALAVKVARYSVPEALLTPAEVGVLCGGYSVRYVLEKLVKSPGFPAPVRLPLPGQKVGDPRWRCGEVRDFLAGLGKKSGRARRRLVSE